MITNLKELTLAVQAGKPKRLAVAAAHDEKILTAVNQAKKLGLAESILVGRQADIERIAKDIGMDLSGFEIIDVAEDADIAATAIKLVHDGKADLPMKGLLETSTILRAVLNADYGLRTDALLTHVGLNEVAGFDRFIIVSDSAMNIAPDLAAKVHIINNSVKVAHALGNKEPKVAVLCAVATVNAKMPATVDAAALTEMNEKGEIKGCLVKGPLALDNAVSEKAAKLKKIDHPVAGNADILIMPNIEAGNIFTKSLEYFAGSGKAGVIVGAKAPVVLTSRASSTAAKLDSIALGVLLVQNA